MTTTDKASSRARSEAGVSAYAAQRQPDVKRCLTCGETERRDAPFVAVLTPTRGQHHWVHAGPCHGIHSARCKAPGTLDLGAAA